jgi:hypothetical protein
MKKTWVPGHDGGFSFDSMPRADQGSTKYPQVLLGPVSQMGLMIVKSDSSAGI